MKYQCKECEKMLSSGFRLKNHLMTQHNIEINSATSSMVTEKANSVDSTEKAKSAMIVEQATLIKKLQNELMELKQTKTDLEQCLQQRKITNKKV